MANSYATVSELRDYIGKTVTDDDATLQNLLDAAKVRVDRVCNRPDGFVALPTAAARMYAGSGKAVQYIDECVAITKVEVKEAATDATYVEWTDADWQAFHGDPKRPDFNRTPYTAIMTTPSGDYLTFTSGSFSGRRGFTPENWADRQTPTVRVTARWGYAATVPATIKSVTIMQAVRWWKRLQSGMSDGIGNVEFGFVLLRSPVDPDIMDILERGRYIRPAIG